MKKLLSVLLVLVLLVTLALVVLRTHDVDLSLPLLLLRPTTTTIGDSSRFSENELKAGAKIARSYVRDFTGVLRVAGVLYDEARSDAYWEHDFETGRFQKEDTMVFFVDFVTGGHTGSLNLWSVYTDWSVTLTRGADGAWSVAASGYA